MRIGLYGLPTAGKSFILDRIDFLEAVAGSKLLHWYDPEFENKDKAGRDADRRAIAKIMQSKSDFIMDGHYAFGEEISFTEDDGNLYDVFLYLFVDPKTLSARIAKSLKNSKYLKYDIAEWQNREITELRKYSHSHNKDFYVLDNPPENQFDDIEILLDFIRAIKGGYSCVNYAKACSTAILEESDGETITLLDGDKTLTIEDSSLQSLGYTTRLFDGNYYTGYQAWKHHNELKNCSVPVFSKMPVNLNDRVLSLIGGNPYILTSGHKKVWQYISTRLEIPFFGGEQMSADTKYYITKNLQEAGKTVIAFGDSMNDYYMMKQANVGYLICKQDGQVSQSLKGCDLEGLILV